ncbi:MAG: 30S ribosome-binding factor RbfA [Phycisphaerae bacterium]
MRVESLIQSVLGEILLKKISDPRVDPARTSITRVEVPEDLLTAKVFVSILGTDREQKNAIAALRHAGGHIQELLSEEITLRHTPVLSFELDVQFKKTLETLRIIREVGDELRAKEAARAAASDDQRDE